jgi:hypothetical protein
MSMKKASLVALLGLGLAGCAADYVTNNSSPVELYFVSINSGTPLKSDVDPVVADTVTAALANRAKNPNLPITQKVPEAIILERYDVQYYRSDGRNTEGVDVPYRISGNMTFGFDVDVSGTVNVPIEVVRAQAKLEPPLRNLRRTSSTSTDFGGNALVITCFARVTVYGHTIAGEAVTAVGTLQIDFADYQ